MRACTVQYSACNHILQEDRSFSLKVQLLVTHYCYYYTEDCYCYAADHFWASNRGGAACGAAAAGTSAGLATSARARAREPANMLSSFGLVTSFVP